MRYCFHVTVMQQTRWKIGLPCWEYFHRVLKSKDEGFSSNRILTILHSWRTTEYPENECNIFLTVLCPIVIDKWVLVKWTN